MESLYNCFGGVRLALFKPPVHERELGSRQIVSQHIERYGAINTEAHVDVVGDRVAETCVT